MPIPSKIEIGSTLFTDHFGLNPRLNPRKFSWRDDFSFLFDNDICRIDFFYQPFFKFLRKEGRKERSDLRSTKSLQFDAMNAPDPRSKKKSCNNASNPRKQRQIRVSYTCFVWWGKKKKTRALGNGSKDRSLKRDNDSMDLKTEDVGRRSPFRTVLIFLYPTSSLFPDHLLLFFGTKATLNSRRNAWIWTGVRCPHTSLVCVCVCVCLFAADSCCWNSGSMVCARKLL